ncbi:unnamed protein product [Merluccius merluccius]
MTLKPAFKKHANLLDSFTAAAAARHHRYGPSDRRSETAHAFAAAAAATDRADGQPPARPAPAPERFSANLGCQLRTAAPPRLTRSSPPLAVCEASSLSLFTSVPVCLALPAPLWQTTFPPTFSPPVCLSACLPVRLSACLTV